MKQLYEVEIKMYIAAEDEEAAENILLKKMPEINSCDCSIYEAKTVHTDFIKSIPFGEENSLTCGEYLKLRRISKKTKERIINNESKTVKFGENEGEVSELEGWYFIISHYR